jgi:hypothetical protein
MHLLRFHQTPTFLCAAISACPTFMPDLRACPLCLVIPAPPFAKLGLPLTNLASLPSLLLFLHPLLLLTAGRGWTNQTRAGWAARSKRSSSTVTVVPLNYEAFLNDPCTIWDGYSGRAWHLGAGFHTSPGPNQLSCRGVSLFLGVCGDCHSAPFSRIPCPKGLLPTGQFRVVLAMLDTGHGPALLLMQCQSVSPHAAILSQTLLADDLFATAMLAFCSAACSAGGRDRAGTSSLSICQSGCSCKDHPACMAELPEQTHLPVLQGPDPIQVGGDNMQHALCP